jgi:hypothetical protein
MTQVLERSLPTWKGILTEVVFALSHVHDEYLARENFVRRTSLNELTRECPSAEFLQSCPKLILRGGKHISS